MDNITQPIPDVVKTAIKGLFGDAPIRDIDVRHVLQLNIAFSPAHAATLRKFKVNDCRVSENVTFDNGEPYAHTRLSIPDSELQALVKRDHDPHGMHTWPPVINEILRIYEHDRRNIYVEIPIITQSQGDVLANIARLNSYFKFVLPIAPIHYTGTLKVSHAAYETLCANGLEIQETNAVRLRRPATPVASPGFALAIRSAPIDKATAPASAPAPVTEGGSGAISLDAIRAKRLAEKDKSTPLK